MKKLLGLIFIAAFFTFPLLAQVAAPVAAAAPAAATGIFAWVQGNWAVIATVLWGICEVLALTPLKSNSIFTLIYNVLKPADPAPATK